MKAISRIAAAISVCMAALSIASCTNDMKEIGDMPEFVTGFTVACEDLDLSGLEAPDTKVTYNVTRTKIEFSFSVGDRLGIFPIGGEQCAFPLSQLEDGGSAKFDGGAWALRSSYEYSAYFPLNPDKYETQNMVIPVNFRNQSQTGNSSSNGLGASACLFSKASKPDSKGNVDIQMKQCAGLARAVATIPANTTVERILFKDNTSSFILEGNVDLNAFSTSKDQYPSMTDTKTGTLILTTKDLTTKSGENNLLVFFWLPPQNLDGHELQMDIITSRDKTITLKTVGTKALAANGAIGLDFGSYIQDERPGGYEAVDMGLSVRWAAYNVGATSIYGIGSYFAWGETETKSNYSSSTYKYGNWRNNVDSPTSGLSKYTGTVQNGDGLITLLPEDDPATVKWGTYWRTPSPDEWKELADSANCEWTWDSTSNCAIATSKITGNSIRFYIGRKMDGTGLDLWPWASFWTNTVKDGSVSYAYQYSIYEGNDHMERSSSGREYGLNVRAVTGY